MALREGDRTPDFELKDDTGETVRFSELLKRHRYTVVAFFPAAFSSVCTNEMNIFQEALGDLEELGAGVVAISVDNHHSLREFKSRNGLEFTLLSDFHPQGAVATQFGVMGDDGAANRALFLVDQDRTIHFVQAVERGVNPGVAQVLEKLEELSGEGQQWRATGTG